jgi:hypothetical protein
VEYIRVNRIDDPLFKGFYALMQKVFPPEEVLAFELWAEPLQDDGINLFVAVHEGEVVGATEYRYYADLNVAMTDFTLIGKHGLGIGPFLAESRKAHLFELASAAGNSLFGMFAEIYDPYRVEHQSFGGIKPMDPFVRREVLSHLGYRKLDFPYVHPSWQNDGTPVSDLDLCFLPFQPNVHSLPSELVVAFLKKYYSALTNKPEAWYEMIRNLEQVDQIPLVAI